MNRVFLIGNLTRDPELTVTSSDITNCKFSVAVTRSYNKRETDFFTIVCWRGLAENCGKYLRKGSKVGISGSVQNNNYEGSDGVRRYTTEIVADEVQFLTSKAETEDAEETEIVKPAKISELTPVADDDKLPF
ncbi:MAG TPA: single-stranded DNA-binding protein [Clostridia bacterium]|nr:single-stranded DNA-binding protein [Clostridia bacterium]